MSDSRAQDDLQAPTELPVLARGRHRSARRGACLMEYVSVLAGERWSDHPTCTDPTLGRLARLVNDGSGDADRGRLALLAPSLIGLRSDDAQMRRRVALTALLRAASVALEVVPDPGDRPLAVTVLRCRDELAASGMRSHVDAVAERALARAPRASRWAREQLGSATFRRAATAPVDTDAMLVLAVQSMVRVCPPDLDGLLRRMLDATTADARTILAAAPTIRAVSPTRIDA